jgi:putative ABC transport system permease protein
MDIQPIISALRRHKAGTILIVLQIALTLAIVCNALSIIRSNIERMARPTGIVETNLLTVMNSWVGSTDGNVLTPLIRTDLETLRSLPGVEDATVMNSFPLRGGGWSTGVRLDNTQEHWLFTAGMYASDDHALATLGVHLVAGRNFRPEEIVDGSDFNTLVMPPVTIITKAMADRLFPDGSALGKTVYLNTGKNAPPTTIIGIVDRLHVAWSSSFADTWAQDVAIVPARLTNRYSDYLIRARPGMLNRLVTEAPAALVKEHRERVFPPHFGIRTFDQVRQDAYRTDRGMAVIMGVVSLALLLITGAGIVGLTSFWVGQRRAQIGVRRALGATRRDILLYFLTENFLITLAGVAIGIALCGALNIWMAVNFEVSHVPLAYIGAGIVLLLALGQAATLNPAMRATRVSPVEATRPG